MNQTVRKYNEIHVQKTVQDSKSRLSVFIEVVQKRNNSENSPEHGIAALAQLAGLSSAAQCSSLEQGKVTSRQLCASVQDNRTIPSQ